MRVLSDSVLRKGPACDLPVLLPFTPNRMVSGSQGCGSWVTRGLVLIVVALFVTVFTLEAQAGPGQPGIILTMLKWTPLLATGFGFNVLISVM